MEPNERPIIKVPLTIIDKVIEILAMLLLIGFWGYNVFHYAALPEVIPTHFSGDGSVDGYGDKSSLFLLPIIATALYIGLSLAARSPHKFNYMATITEANAPKQYAIAMEMLRGMKLAIVLVFFAIDYKTIQVSSGHDDGTGGWFMLFIMSMVFGPLFYFLIKMSKNS